MKSDVINDLGERLKRIEKILEINGGSKGAIGRIEDRLGAIEHRNKYKDCEHCICKETVVRDYFGFGAPIEKPYPGWFTCCICGKNDFKKKSCVEKK